MVVQGRHKCNWLEADAFVKLFPLNSLVKGVTMSNEEFHKKAEFIVEQQTQFASKIGQLEDIVARLAKATLDRFEVSDERIDEIDKRIAALINSQIQTEENVKKTDEHLRNLIAVVDPYFREGRNGGTKI
jgi:hypothetical protein